MTDGRFDPNVLISYLSNYGHGKLLNLEFRDAGSDWVEAALPWREELVGLTAQGSMASSVIVSLLDTCGGVAVYQRFGRLTEAATIDLRVDYLRSARKGETVVARCECYKLTRQIAFVRGTARSEDGEPIAQAAGTFIVSA